LSRALPVIRLPFFRSATSPRLPYDTGRGRSRPLRQ
jgi:hypothetical protein